MTDKNLVLKDLEQALLEAKRTGDSEAVLHELSRVEDAWWVINKKGETPNVDLDNEGIGIFTSEEKAALCAAQLEGKGPLYKGLKPTNRFSFPKSFHASFLYKYPVVVNRFSPEEWTASYEEVGAALRK